MGRPIKRICKECHANRLRMDLLYVLDGHRRKPVTLPEKLLDSVRTYYLVPWVVEMITQAAERIEHLEAAIRTHRDARGDDRCWRDDEDLYKVLPEGYTPPVRDTSVELDLCRQYIACRQNPATIYTSPQREIEKLTAALDARDLATANQVRALVASVIPPEPPEPPDVSNASIWYQAIRAYRQALKDAL